MANLDSMERVWFDRRKFEVAECKFAEYIANEHSSLVVEVTILLLRDANHLCIVCATQGVGMKVDPVTSDDASPPTSSSSSVKVSPS